MAACLVALGANLGDRRATLDSALAALAAAPQTTLLRHSSWHSTRPVGMASRHEFLNGAAVVETALEPAALFAELQQIETEHGRQRGGHWADRTLDLDLLLFADQIIDTPALVVPHPRMSFRRFVLEPSAEIAADLMHPVLGWTIGQLCAHLESAGNVAAIVSPRAKDRSAVVEMLASRWNVAVAEPPPEDEVTSLWPVESTTWLRLVDERPAAEVEATAAQLPKLSILLDCGPALERKPGRGPTLALRDCGPADVEREVLSAVESVWPDLGRRG
jgi:2-amino-4-hydroxy-6-hydroxymethyldihydropteridine diphosphokinase